MSKALTAAALLLLCTLAAPSQSQPAPMLIGRISASRTHIAFFYAGDVWTVERAGGEARKLPAPQGTQTQNFPVFSPDGSQLAFSRQTGGNWDLFVAPASGGEVRRLTFHPANDWPQGWTPDGRSVLFSSNRDPDVRLYTVAADGSQMLPT